MVQLLDMELKQLIFDAYWLETHLESFNEFIGWLHVKEPVYKKTIESIGRDSEQHKRILEDLIDKIEFLDLNQLKSYKGNNELNMNLGTINEEEIMKVLLKNERLVYSFYEKMYNMINRERLNDVWTGENVDEFFQTIKRLMQWETKHIALVEDSIHQNKTQIDVKQIS